MLTQQEIIALAVEAGLSEITGPIGALLDSEIACLQRFASLAAQQARNACLAEIETGIWMDKTTDEVLADIADAIRARSDVRKVACTHRHPSFSHDGKDICHLCGKEKPSANESADGATIPTSSTTE